MSLIMRKPKIEEPETTIDDEQRDFSADDLQEGKAEKPDLRITALCGANKDQFDLAGQRVDSARQLLANILNIEAEAASLVNGQEVSADYVLQQDDQLEFVKKAGEKG